MPDYAEITAIAADEDGGDRTLSPFSISFLNFACTFYAERRHVWENDGEPLTNAEWDTIQAGIAETFYEVNNPAEAIVKRWVFVHEEEQNIAGGATVIGSNILPFPDTRFSDGAEVTQAGGVFTLAPGKWLIYGWHQVFGTGDVSVQLNWTGAGGLPNRFGETFITGTALTAHVHFSDAGDIALDETFTPFIVASAANPGDGLGTPINQLGRREYYGELIFMRLGDV